MEAHVVTLRAQSTEACLDIAQTLPVSELRTRHGQILSNDLKIPGLVRLQKVLYRTLVRESIWKHIAHVGYDVET